MDLLYCGACSENQVHDETPDSLTLAPTWYQEWVDVTLQQKSTLLSLLRDLCALLGNFVDIGTCDKCRGKIQSMHNALCVCKVCYPRKLCNVCAREVLALRGPARENDSHKADHELERCLPPYKVDSSQCVNKKRGDTNWLDDKDVDNFFNSSPAFRQNGAFFEK
jgi:hypothetical protein